MKENNLYNIAFNSQIYLKGLDNLVTVPDNEFTNAIFQVIEDDSEVCLLFPTKDTGNDLKEEYARRLGKKRVTLPNLQGYESLNELHNEHGNESVKIAIENRVPYPIDNVFTAEAFKEEFYSLYHKGLSKGTTTKHWNVFDDMFSILPGQLTTVTGVSGHGKSTFLDNYLILLAKNRNWKFGVFSPENGLVSNHMQRLARQYIGKGFSDGSYNRMTEKELDIAYKFIKEHFFFMRPNPEDFNIEKISEMAYYLVKVYGIHSVLVDPFNRLNLRFNNKQEAETTAISRFLSEYHYLAQELGTHNFLVAHPTKLPKMEDNINDKRPSVNDIAGSVHFRNVSDNVLSVYGHREEINNKVVFTDNLISIQKVKYEHLGHLGTVHFDFDRETQRYTENEKNMQNF